MSAHTAAVAPVRPAEGMFALPVLQAMDEAVARHVRNTFWSLGPVTLELRVVAVNGQPVGPAAAHEGGAP